MTVDTLLQSYSRNRSSILVVVVVEVVVEVVVVEEVVVDKHPSIHSPTHLPSVG
jgi:hypothetical protein